MIDKQPPHGQVVAVTGLSGFVGGRFAELYGGRLTLIDWYRSRPVDSVGASYAVDTTDLDTVRLALDRDQPRAVVNIAAQANVDVCEQEREDRDGPAWRSNVIAAGVLARACRERRVRLVHVSTDYVFSGREGPYREDSPTSHAANWYGETKLEGERTVQENGGNVAIARIVLPYRKPPASRIDFPQLVRTRLTTGQPFVGAIDQMVTPTLLDDIADALTALAMSDDQGIYHLAGATLLTPYEAALVVARTFGLDESLVRPGTLAEITSQSNRAPRPVRTALLSDRFREEFSNQLPRPLRGFIEGIGTLR